MKFIESIITGIISNILTDKGKELFSGGKEQTKRHENKKTNLPKTSKPLTDSTSFTDYRTSVPYEQEWLSFRGERQRFRENLEIEDRRRDQELRGIRRTLHMLQKQGNWEEKYWRLEDLYSFQRHPKSFVYDQFPTIKLKSISKPTAPCSRCNSERESLYYIYKSNVLCEHCIREAEEARKVISSFVKRPSVYLTLKDKRELLRKYFNDATTQILYKIGGSDLYYIK